MPRHFVSEGGYYNEIVIEFDAFYSSLPESIDAIFYIEGPCTDRRPQPWVPGRQQAKCEEYARWAHAELQRRWPQRARDIPLLRLNPRNWTEPFSLAGGA